MSTTTSRPRVPQLVMDKTGQHYGGQYWDQAEYRVTLDAPADGSTVGPFILDLANTQGTSLDKVTLTTDQAWKLTTLNLGTLRKQMFAGIRGLDQTITWDLGCDMADQVQLTDGDIDQICEWCHYALGLKEWDYDEQGDEWVY